jgi:hypothetical protein
MPRDIFTGGMACRCPRKNGAAEGGGRRLKPVRGPLDALSVPTLAALSGLSSAVPAAGGGLRALPPAGVPGPWPPVPPAPARSCPAPLVPPCVPPLGAGGGRKEKRRCGGFAPAKTQDFPCLF